MKATSTQTTNVCDITIVETKHIKSCRISIIKYLSTDIQYDSASGKNSGLFVNLQGNNRNETHMFR